MIRFFAKPYRWAALLSLLLSVSFVYVLLDSFVIPRAQVQVVPAPSTSNTSKVEKDTLSNAEAPLLTENTPSESSAPDEAAPPAEPVVTATSYSDENIKITIETMREYDTTFYVADIQISDPTYLKTALAGNTFGRNIKDTTSAMAQEHDAIFAVNGDYYGFRDNGYVLRNGILYREGGSGQALVIDGEGNLSLADEGVTSAQVLLEGGAWQVFSFGPDLVENGEITVNAQSEVSKSKSSNPRTAIGQVSALHYIIIVSDGRTNESEGLSLLALAEQFERLGCATAYNLDGGGSSTMYFDGTIINNPTNGRSAKEREVSDIVYIGYE